MSNHWQMRYNKLVQAAAEAAFARLMRQDVSRLFLMHKRVNNGQWGELGFLTEYEDEPDGWELSTPEFVVTSAMTKEQMYAAIKQHSGRLPIIGDDAA